jgi:septal ring factor EnvC (AmiA/AmiB activator)
VERQSGACQGYMGSLPRADCTLDGSMHGCSVSSAGEARRGNVSSYALLEATKITLDNREELVVDLSTEMVEKDLQVEQMSNEIQELEELVGTRENTIEVLEDQLINTQQQLAEANQHLDMHHQEIQDMEANEDVDIEGGEEPEPASSLDTAGLGRPPSPESSVASFAH